MKEMEYGFSGIMMKVDNEKIERFVRIWNRDCESKIKKMLEDPDWYRTISEDGRNWWIEDQARQATGFYFMELLPEPELTTSDFIKDFMLKEYERRKAVGDETYTEGLA